MLPTEQFSGDATEDKSIWTPQVWTKGPDGLVNQAQTALFQDRADVEVGALGAGISSPAIDGPVSQGGNEQDQVINPGQPPEGQGRATQWKNTLDIMRTTDPLAGNIRPNDYDPSPGEANPNV
jgi:hypothetical protein